VRGLSLIVAFVAALAATSAAWGHAGLLGSEPVNGAVVGQSPKTITLTFNEPVSPLRVRLVAPDGEAVDLQGVTAKDQSVTVAVPGTLSRGTHLLSWRVISADGHPVGGTVSFSVLEPSASPPMLPRAEADRPLQIAIWLCKILLYCGLMFGVGGALYGAWIAKSQFSAVPQALISFALAGGTIAAVLSVGLQGADAMALPLSGIRQTTIWLTGLQTSYGATAVIAIAAFTLASSRRRAGSPGRWRTTAAIVAAGAALAVSGHAASAEPQWLTRPAVFLHGVAVAFWAGAFMPLASALASAERRAAELARFSRAIPIALVLLIATGSALAIVQLRSVDALWTTSYGLILSAKLAAVALLLALGALNRYALTPPAIAGDTIAATRLRTSIKAELAIVVLIFGLVAGWRFTPPPRTLQLVAAAPVQVHIHTDRAMADLRFEPARAGSRSVAIALWDGNFAPLAAKEVTLQLASPDAGIEPLRLPAVWAGESSWRVDKLTIPLHGRWRITVEILIDDFSRTALTEDVEF
jgi:copper transport protein